jgi:2-polyprenyl-3-methyl-5-hydroxy-6-metoxy-1,4-benzoquinol methylase
MTADQYDGSLRERTLPGVHGDVLEVIRTYRPAGQGKVSVLDLGAGEGALSARLKAAGYHVLAVEIEEGRFQVPDVPCSRLDLNQRFSDQIGARFDLVLAVEVIEHLDNPREFLRQCVRLVRPDGLILITSPNVENWDSRLVFLKHGVLPFFTEPSYRESGHLAPLFTWQMERRVKEMKWRIVERRTAGARPDWQQARMHSGGGTGFLGKLLLRVFLAPIMKGTVKGTINLFVLGPASS